MTRRLAHGGAIDRGLGSLAVAGPVLSARRVELLDHRGPGERRAGGHTGLVEHVLPGVHGRALHARALACGGPPGGQARQERLDALPDQGEIRLRGAAIGGRRERIMLEGEGRPKLVSSSGYWILMSIEKPSSLDL